MFQKRSRYILCFLHCIFFIIVFPGINVRLEPAIQLFAIWDIADIGSDEHVSRFLTAVTIDLQGDIYLTDSKNNSILKFSSQGKLISEIGGFGWENDQFDQPVSISASNGLDVFIADHMNHRVVRYDNKLNFISTLTSDENLSNTLQFGYPRDVQISDQGELFLIDGENQRLLKFDVLGNPQQSFGDFDDHEGNLVLPERFKIDQDLVYVTDSDLAKIFIFDIHGNFLSTFSHPQLKAPSALTLYHDLLFIIDHSSNCIHVFTKRGEYHSHFGPVVSQGVLLKNPVDLAFYGNHLYIVEQSQSQILIFKCLGF